MRFLNKTKYVKNMLTIDYWLFNKCKKTKYKTTYQYKQTNYQQNSKICSLYNKLSRVNIKYMNYCYIKYTSTQIIREVLV